jgi:hypothetical protein
VYRDGRRLSSRVCLASCCGRLRPPTGGQEHPEGGQEAEETAEVEVNMRWGDPLIGRMELYFLVGVAALLGIAYLVRAVVG